MPRFDLAFNKSYKLLMDVLTNLVIGASLQIKFLRLCRNSNVVKTRLANTNSRPRTIFSDEYLLILNIVPVSLSCKSIVEN